MNIVNFTGNFDKTSRIWKYLPEFIASRDLDVPENVSEEEVNKFLVDYRDPVSFNEDGSMVEIDRLRLSALPDGTEFIKDLELGAKSAMREHTEEMNKLEAHRKVEYESSEYQKDLQRIDRELLYYDENNELSGETMVVLERQLDRLR